MDSSWYQIKGANIEGTAMWIGAPGNFTATDITKPVVQVTPDIIAPNGRPYARQGNLSASITILFKKPVDVGEIDIKLGDIARPGTVYHLPSIDRVRVAWKGEKDKSMWAEVRLEDIEESQLYITKPDHIAYGTAGVGKNNSSYDWLDNKLNRMRDKEEFGGSSYNPTGTMQNNIYTPTSSAGPEANQRWSELMDIREKKKSTSEYQFLKRWGFAE